jgi:pimeloyl-ACP methyl ester carboxylesterase
MNAPQKHEMKTIRTSVLEIAYFDDGPKDGEPVLLLHGWPEAPGGFAVYRDRSCCWCLKRAQRALSP